MNSSRGRCWALPSIKKPYRSVHGAATYVLREAMEAFAQPQPILPGNSW